MTCQICTGSYRSSVEFPRQHYRPIIILQQHRRKVHICTLPGVHSVSPPPPPPDRQNIVRKSRAPAAFSIIKCERHTRELRKCNAPPTTMPKTLRPHNAYTISLMPIHPSHPTNKPTHPAHPASGRRAGTYVVVGALSSPPRVHVETTRN